jgi:hypothetical protein
MAEFDDNFRVAPGSSSITANYLEVGRVVIGDDQGWHMAGFDRVGDGLFDERPRRSAKDSAVARRTDKAQLF